METFYYGDDDKQDQAVNFELKRFQNREGSFAKKLARSCQNFDYNAGMHCDFVKSNLFNIYSEFMQYMLT